jgi:uncharacterized protein (DUF1330 family)
MSAYVIVHVTVTNPEAYADYARQVPATLAPHGGEFLVRGGETTVVEGEMPHARHVVLRFPNRAAAEAWHNSAEYQEILAIRHANSTGVMLIADGYDG